MLAQYLGHESTDAPAYAVHCFSVFEGSIDSLAKKHQVDVGIFILLPDDICFFHPLNAQSPSACLAVCLAHLSGIAAFPCSA